MFLAITFYFVTWIYNYFEANNVFSLRCQLLKYKRTQFWLKLRLYHVVSEVEALNWAMECMKNLRQFRVTFSTDCS